MGISHTLFRRFFWAENILWKEDTRGHHVTVALAEKDLIVDTKAVATYLTGGKEKNLAMGGWEDGIWKGDELDVLWFQEIDHAQVFDRKETKVKLVDIVQKYCAWT